MVSTAANFATTVSSQTGLTSLTAALSSLSNSATYYWEVSATNVGGTSAWSGAWSFTTIIATPATPALAAPASGAINQPVSLSLSWGSVTGAASYSVMVSTAANFASTVSSQTGLTSLSAALSSLSNSATYYWEVSATNVGGTSAWSGAWSFTTVIPVPSAPILSLPSNNAAGQFLALTLAWGTVASASSYEVQVSLATDFSSTIIDQSGLGTASLALNGLSNSSTYYWRANASNIGGNGTWSSVWSFSTQIQLQIPLLAAWNMKSFNVVPQNDSTSVVFGTPSTFLFVKNNAGAAYCPLLGQDDIHYSVVGQGYQIYSAGQDTLNVLGTAVDYVNTPIALASGWNTIGYLPQTNDTIEHAFAAIASSVILVKNNSGHAYWPSLAIDGISVMQVGEGYKVLMSAGASFTFPTPLSGVDKRTAHGPTLLHLPDPRHYGAHANTGSNATLMAKSVLIDNKFAKDSCEIGAYDPAGNLVGAGTVIHGHACFAIWGSDPVTKKKDGCATGATITFKLWDGAQEYLLDYESAGGAEPKYAVDAVYPGNLRVNPGSLIKRFDLTNVYPNPFRGFLRISFDVPGSDGMKSQNIELNVYDMKGSLVHQIARGAYMPGHYTVSWSTGEVRGESLGSSMYIICMKAKNFDKRIKLIRVQ
jgi:hypothetical protein